MTDQKQAARVLAAAGSAPVVAVISSLTFMMALALSAPGGSRLADTFD